MARTFTTIFFNLLFFISLGQSIDDFKVALQKSLDNDFSEEQLNKLFREQGIWLTPHNDITVVMSNLHGEDVPMYPLQSFKSDSLYTNNINDLFNSENENQRVLSYLLIASVGDSTFEMKLLDRLKEESSDGLLIWAGMALLHLRTDHTTPLFDFLVENEDFGDAHMIPMYIELNVDSLRNTAYNRINSSNMRSKVLAAQILSVTGLTEETDRVLKEAVTNWDINIKGYAIYSMKELGMRNLRELLEPLLDSAQTRSIAIKALANSPSERDQTFLMNLTVQQDTVSRELMNSFLESKRADNVIFWLELLYTKPISEDYLFFIFDHPLLFEDSMLPHVHKALEQISNTDYLEELVRALKGREDEKSLEILFSLLEHNDSGVRYWTARAFEGSKLPQLNAKLPKLIENPLTRSTSLMEIAIENELDTLQTLIETIYKNDPSRDWKRTCVEYLSYFPLERHIELFRGCLEDDDEDTFVKRDAAMGLARLGDEQSVELIIATSRKEAQGSEYNVKSYLVALSMFNSELAKEEIRKYVDSSSKSVRNLVNELLKE